MVQNYQQRLATDLVIDTGTILTPDQFSLTQVSRARPGPSGLPVLEGSADMAVGTQLYLRMRVTESFDTGATLLDVIPVTSDSPNLASSLAIEHYRARLAAASLTLNSTWHFPLRPISPAEALDPGTGTPIWPIQLAYFGAKFTVSGGGGTFGTGKVTCDVTTHVSPGATNNVIGAAIYPPLPLAGW